MEMMMDGSLLLVVMVVVLVKGSCSGLLLMLWLGHSPFCLMLKLTFFFIALIVFFFEEI
jgi:hypothetical protein